MQGLARATEKPSAQEQWQAMEKQCACSDMHRGSETATIKAPPLISLRYSRWLRFGNSYPLAEASPG
jgi:hypothetical protein